MSTFILIRLLFDFKSLPQLFLLTIYLVYCFDDRGDIYLVIFHLPALKYFKIDISEYQKSNISIPVATDQQFSPIEYLIIYHNCTLNELTDLLSYTPNLSHLYCCNGIKSDADIKSEILVKLTNLVHLTISVYDIYFREFEMFLLKLCSLLASLSVTIECLDKNYLDSYRWEQLIRQNMTHLKRFIFCYTDVINDRFEIHRCHPLINGFTSSFWIDRQWIFKLRIQRDELSYLIHPYTKTWIDFHEYRPNDNDNSSNHYFPVIQLSVSDTLLTKKDESIIDKIHPIFDMIQLTCLDIYCDKMSIRMFIQMLDCLSNLKSIRISDFPLHDRINSHESELIIWDKFLLNNEIINLTLRNIANIQEVTCIIDIFPRIQYLSLQYVWNVDLESFVRCILLKIKENNISHPMTICIFCVGAEYDKVQKLKQMIDSEHLLEDYTINRQLNRFYIQWK